MERNALKAWLNRHSILLSALLISGIIYGIFFAQGLYSDTVTFAKSGDQLRQCFPVFVKLSEFISHGKLSGITIGTFNGLGNATALTAARYLPQLFFAAIANFMNNRLAYILFYWFHLFLVFYYGQKISIDILEITGYGRYLFPVSVMGISLLNSWFTSFMALGTMMIPGIYYSFMLAKGDKRHYTLPMALTYVLIFTSGYHTYACIGALLIVLISSAYGCWMNPQEHKLAIIKRTWLPGIIGGIVSAPFLLNIFIDIISKAKGTQNLADVLALSVYPPDLLGIFTNSYINNSQIEQMGLLRVGIAWSIVSFFMIKDHVLSELQSAEKKLFIFGIVSNIILLLISLGSRTPFAVWLFLIPIFGGAHLPIRYMIITLPFFYLSLCIGWKHLKRPTKKSVIVSFLLILLCTIVINIATEAGITERFDLAKLWLELFVSAVFLYVVMRKGWHSPWAISCFCMIIALFVVNSFYVLNEITVRSAGFEARSIVFSANRQKNLNTAVRGLEEKDIYRWIEIDAKESVPGVIPNRLDEYGCFDYHLTNYLGYSLHNKDRDYTRGNQISWFDKFDWGYLLDTQADLLIIDQEKWDKNPSFFESLADPTYKRVSITNELFAVKLNKFIPQYYIENEEYLPNGIFLEYQGEKYYINRSDNYLDNGVFYCPTLTSHCLTAFESNYIDYFYGEFNIEKASSIEFLFYPNPYLHFYDNNVEIAPIFDHRNASIAYLRLEPGLHNIEIRYENILDEISCFVLIGFAALCACSAIYVGPLNRFFKKRNSGRRKGL